ncbi:MAG: hypothetical protein HQL08_03660 [Nitrospirae bacterium]|nr:hypothetical protein [Nitrospirota bacterium]
MKTGRGLEAKTEEMAKKGLYAGVGAGLVLFALIGLLPGSFIGGVIGINICGGIFGLPLTASILPRIIVGACMVMGVMMSGVVFVTGGAIAGWLSGHIFDALKETGTADMTHAHAGRIK